MNSIIAMLRTILSYIYPLPIATRKGALTSSLHVVYSMGKRMLDTDKVNYSYGTLHEIFLRTFRSINIKERSINKVLILGFGAGSVASLLTERFHKDCEICGVELDTVVLDIAKEYFDIDRFEKLSIHQKDAYEFVIECDETYDLIVVDLFIDNHTPRRFAREEFLIALECLLSSTGAICYNRMLDTVEAREENKRFSELFVNVFQTFSIQQYFLGGVLNEVYIHDRLANKIEFAVLKSGVSNFEWRKVK